MIEINATCSRDIKMQSKMLMSGKTFVWDESANCDCYANNECLRNKWLGSDNNLPATSTLPAHAPTDYDHRTVAKLENNRIYNDPAPS